MNKVIIKIEHINGLKEDIKLSLNGDPIPEEPTLNKYEIIKNKGIAVLHLNQLVNDKLYSDMLDDFFREVKDNKIGTIIGEPAGNAPTHYGAPKTIPLTRNDITEDIDPVMKWLESN